MGSFKNLKISAKLLSGFLAVLALAAVLGVVSIIKLASMNENVSQLGDNWLEAVYALGRMNNDASSLRRIELAYYGTEDVQVRASYEQQFADAKADMKKAMEAYEPTITLEIEKRLYPEIKDSYERFLAGHERAMALLKEHKNKEANTLFYGDVKNLFYKTNSDIGQLVDANYKAALDEAKVAHLAYGSARLTTILVLAGTILCGLILAFWIARLIGNPLRRAADQMKEAERDRNLAMQLEADSNDEVGQICTTFNSFVKTLHEVITQVANVAEHVASASEEISSSATQQAQGAETQKDQTSQVATAMQEMSSTVMQVSENSNKAAESSRQAAETARHGGAIVEQTLNKMRTIAESVGATARKMEELGKSSDQIGRIIGVIDDIADQTNLLALNAAIEAARAGEQGRGFAVVADEVRKLAERTTTATKEIAQMIKNIQDETKTAVAAMEEGTKQVEDGVKSTSQAGDSLKEIIQMSEQVGEMITHIATAATEQSSASEEINKNMEQIAKLVKESTVGAQQSAKACQDLSGLALDLQKMVGNFKLESGNGYSSGARHHASSSSPDEPARPKAFAAAAH